MVDKNPHKKAYFKKKKAKLPDNVNEYEERQKFRDMGGEMEK